VASGAGDWWVLLHGTPLTPAVWDEVAAHLSPAGSVAAISAPVTLIAAELDPVSTPAAMSALASRLPRASLTVLPGAAHMSPFTDPAALAALTLGGQRS
jgi:pimeloyl-ACP methyl ester carboxylesterase